MKFLLVSCFLFFSFAGSGQSLIDLVEKATELFQKGDYAKAIPAAERAAKSAREQVGENNLIYMTMVKVMAESHYMTYQYEKAVLLYIQFGELVRQTSGEKDRRFAAYCNNLASVYADMGQYQKAEGLYIRAGEITKSIVGEKDSSYALCLNNLAFLYQLTGQYTKAEPLFVQAREIRKKTVGESHPDYANSLNNLAALYLEVGQYEKAEPLFIQAKEIRKKSLGEKDLQYAASLNNLASLWSNMGLYEKAEPLYIQAKEIRRKKSGETDPEYAASLNNLASLYTEMGQYEKAEPLIIRAKEIWRIKLGESHPNYATSLNNLAALYRKSGKESEKAEKLYIEAIRLRKGILGEMHPWYADSQNDLALLYANMGQYEKAEPLLLSSSNILLQNLVNTFSILSDKEKGNYLNYNNAIIEADNSYLYNFKRASPAVTRNNFNLQLGFKSLALSDTKNLLEAVRNSKDSMIRKLFESWQTRKLLLTRQYGLPLRKRMTDLKKLEAETENLEKELNRRSSEFRDQQIAGRIATEDVQKNLEEDEVAIEFVKFRLYNKKWTDTVVYAAYLLRKKDISPQFVPLCVEKQIQELFEKTAKSATLFAKSVYSRDTTINAAGEKFYQLLWQPLEPYLKEIRKVSYSLAGKLFGIAFHALPCGEGKILLDRYQMQQYVSTRQIALRNSGDQTRKATDIILFGDANFNMDSAELAKERSHNANFVSIPLDRGTNTLAWPDLPGTAEEVKEINQLFEQKRIPAKVFTKTTASEENLKALSDRSPQVLHIATHGFFLPDPEEEKTKNKKTDQTNNYKLAEDPLLRNGLILAGGNYAWGGKMPVEGVEDGIVTAYEIAQLNLGQTDLIVLSACETALGDVKGSEGVFGLQRGFKMAGAKKMILSLWRVPDKETRELMTDFYSHWLGGETINEAFYQAQLGMRKKYAPFYWAAFVLVE